MLDRLKGAWRVLRHGAPPSPEKTREAEEALAALGGWPLPADPTLRIAPERSRRRYYAACEFDGSRVTTVDLAQGCVGSLLPGSLSKMTTRAHSNLMMPGQLPGGYSLDPQHWYARASEPIAGPVADFLAACDVSLQIQSRIVATANLLDLALGVCPAAGEVRERMGWRWEIAPNSAVPVAAMGRYLSREEPESDQEQIERDLGSTRDAAPGHAPPAPASLWPWDVRVWGEQAAASARQWEKHADRLHDVALRASRRRKVERALTIWLVIEGDGTVPVT